MKNVPCSAAVSLAIALLTSACASTNGVGPVAFPGAPRVSADRPRTAPAGVASGAAAIVRDALDLRGVPYRFGGATPSEGFDCSGLVAFVFAQHQVMVPRTVSEQFQHGAPVQPERIEAGDLVFFATTGDSATHVGIALGQFGDRQFVHAPDAGGVVRVDRYDAPYWRTRFLGARRMH
ncbi:MAG TPA: C40 family peptidase [Vicinamibacterales bacterium]|nr:C40 family peptidase [Vicinamibacterales bacterium]